MSSSQQRQPSQYEKFDQIVAWLFQQTEAPIRGVSSIIDRFARNFRIDTRFGGDDGEQSRTPILQFISRCDRLAQTLHRVVLKVVRIEGEDVPYVLPEKTSSSSENQKEKLEHVLQHIVNTLDYIFNYMEDDLALLYMFCDMVAVAEGKKMAPEQAAKKVFFVVERAKRVHVNLARLQTFVLVKHNGPEPSLVQDLILLQQLRQHGFVTADEYEAREMEVIENIVRAFVTKGRFLEQNNQQLTIKREKPISAPAGLSEAHQSAVQKLKFLLDGGFIETNEYNVRVSQIISRWQEERLKEQEERARALKDEAIKNAMAKAPAVTTPAAPKEDTRWTKDAVASEDKLLIPEKTIHVGNVATPVPAEVDDYEEPPPPPPEFDDGEVVDVPQDVVPVISSPPRATDMTANVTRMSKPLPNPAPQMSASQPSLLVSPVAATSPASTPALSQSMPVDVSAEDAAMAKLAAALQQQANAKKAMASSGGAGVRVASPVNNLRGSGAVNSPPPTPVVEKVEKTPVGGVKVEKKRSSIFQRVGSPGGTSPTSLSPEPQAIRRSSVTAADVLAGVGGGIFDDLSVMQMTAKQRNDADAFRIHAVEKKLGAGKKDVIQMKACVDKTFVSEGHSITVKLLVSNLSKKPVNCIKFILSGGVDETPVNTVEDATRDATSSTNDPVFPLVKSTWQGDVQYMLPIVSPGFYKLRVQLFYNTRYNIEVPIALHVLSKQDMWHHNPLQVFGVPLDEVLKREGGVIPLAVARPLEALCRESCLTVEGIFRMSGDLTKILSVRDEMDSGKVPSFTNMLEGTGSQGVHLVAGVLKLFLRLLPHPLFTEALYDEVLAAYAQVKNEPLPAKISVYKPLVARIPESARRLFATLAEFVNRFIIPHNEVNKMHHANMAVIFGPVFLFRSNLSPMEELSNASRVNGAVADFFMAGRELFPEVVDLPGIPKSASSNSNTGSASLAPSARKVMDASLSSPSLLRMGTNRAAAAAAASVGPIAPTSAKPVAKDVTKDVSKEPEKPLKPLPPIPRSAQLQVQQKQSVGSDEEEEESTN